MDVREVSVWKQRYDNLILEELQEEAYENAKLHIEDANMISTMLIISKLNNLKYFLG